MLPLIALSHYLKGNLISIQKGEAPNTRKNCIASVTLSWVLSCRLRLAQQSEKRKKNVVDHSWKRASPMKRSTGPGDFYGTLQGKISYISVL